MMYVLYEDEGWGRGGLLRSSGDGGIYIKFGEARHGSSFFENGGLLYSPLLISSCWAPAGNVEFTKNMFFCYINALQQYAIE